MFGFLVGIPRKYHPLDEPAAEKDEFDEIKKDCYIQLSFLCITMYHPPYPGKTM